MLFECIWIITYRPLGAFKGGGGVKPKFNIFGDGDVFFK